MMKMKTLILTNTAVGRIHEISCLQFKLKAFSVFIGCCMLTEFRLLGYEFVRQLYVVCAIAEMY